MTEDARKVTEQDIIDFVAKVQALVNAHYAKNLPNLTPSAIETSWGARFIKLISVDPAQRSVYGFIEIATGNIFKAASWAAPAKHVRGNIHSPDCMKACTPYGIVYLR